MAQGHQVGQGGRGGIDADADSWRVVGGHGQVVEGGDEIGGVIPRDVEGGGGVQPQDRGIGEAPLQGGGAAADDGDGHGAVAGGQTVAVRMPGGRMPGGGRV